MDMSGPSIRIKKRPYSSIPDDILTDSRMSYPTRVILGWMLGRSEDFEFYVSHVRRVFRISEQQWVKYRKEMQAVGYFAQHKERQADGTFRWINIVSDQPEFQPSPQNPGDGEPSHGQPSHGPQGDIPNGGFNQYKNTTPHTPRPKRGAPKPAGAGLVEELDDEQRQLLADEEDGRRAAISKGDAKPVNDWPAWREAVAASILAKGDGALTESGKAARRRRQADEERRKDEAGEAAKPRATNGGLRAALRENGFDGLIRSL